MTTEALPRLRPFPAVSADPRAAIRRLARGRAADPRWVRPALLAVISLAALLCLWNLSRNGYSNQYYAAAVKSGSESWKAWFFGSIDPGSFITVDKPPLSLWLMGLSARVFGFSSFSMLLPQALCTIAAVGLLYATVRRLFGPPAGVLAAAALATTPVTVAIARVNNPDALLALLLVAAGYLLVRALQSGRTGHLVGCGAVVGLAFMTKMLEGWMVLPALGATYLLAGPAQLRTRIRQLFLAGATTVAVSAAWPVAVSLWPGAKPYIGGSTNGSIWNLIFGYNGFGRLTGSGSGIGGGASFGGTAGPLRMFNAEVGGQIAWLLPLAGVGLLAGLWLTRRAPRTDLRRAGWVLFGVWAFVLVAVFSTQRGIFHPYYVSALAPAVAALAGGGLVTFWALAKRSWVGLVALDGALLATASLAVALLARTPSFAPALRTIIPAAAALAVVSTIALRVPGKFARRGLALGITAAAVVILGGPASYSLANLGRSLNGNNVLAGPASAQAGPMGGAPGGPRSDPARFTRTGTAPASSGSSAGAFGGLGGGGSLSAKTIAYLEAHQGSAKYLVAAVGSQTTAGIIIQTGKAVVTIGGFSGSDPAPTVSQLSSMVAQGQLHYVLLSSDGGGGPQRSSQRLTDWVKAHGTAVSGAGVSGSTLYRLG